MGESFPSKLLLEGEALGGDVVPRERQPLYLSEAFSVEKQAVKQAVDLASQRTAGLTHHCLSFPPSFQSSWIHV